LEYSLQAAPLDVARQLHSFADGLLYQVPEDGAWVRFEAPYAFKGEGMEQPGRGKGTMTMACVGTAVEGSEKCRWIEFNVHLQDSGDATRTF